MADEQKALMRAVATEVMGWTLAGEDEDVYTDGYGGWFELDFGQDIDLDDSAPFNPIDRFAAAGLVIGAMEAKGYQFYRTYKTVFFQKYEDGKWTMGAVASPATADNWRRAMCEAALEAVRSESGQFGIEEGYCVLILEE